MLDDSLATTLGIDLALIPTHYVGGVGTTGVPAKRHLLWIELFGRWVLAPVDFSPNRQPQLLGREGVFDRVVLAFAHGIS